MIISFAYIVPLLPPPTLPLYFFCYSRLSVSYSFFLFFLYVPGIWISLSHIQLSRTIHQVPVFMLAIKLTVVNESHSNYHYSTVMNFRKTIIDLMLNAALLHYHTMSGYYFQLLLNNYLKVHKFILEFNSKVRYVAKRIKITSIDNWSPDVSST